MNTAKAYEERFKQVLAEYERSFRRLAAVYERDPDLQRDLFQEIALAVWRGLPSFRNQCSERTFFYRIAHNRAITHISRRGLLEGDLELASVVPDPRPNPEAQVSGELERREVSRRVAELPLSLRQVAVLALEGLENFEIAQVLGISVGNVGVRLHRAKSQLAAGGLRR